MKYAFNMAAWFMLSSATPLHLAYIFLHCNLPDIKVHTTTETNLLNQYGVYF